MKKYYLRIWGEYGELIFNHSSNHPEKLVKILRKESTSGDGNPYCNYYFATRKETNVPEEYFWGAQK